MRSGLLYSLDFAQAVPCPMLFLPPECFALCPPRARISARLGAPRRKAKVPSRAPHIPGSPCCGLWAVGGRPPGQPSLSPLVGTAGLPQGGEGVGAADRPAREGAVRPCSLTRQLGCPAPQARPPFPLPLVTSGFLPDCPPAQPFSAEQPEGSGTPLATWWGAGMPQRLRRTVQRCLRR